MKDCRWLTPVLVAQIEFLEWTGENHLRHTKFIALRDDKSAREVRRDQPATSTGCENRNAKNACERGRPKTKYAKLACHLLFADGVRFPVEFLYSWDSGASPNVCFRIG
jgi:ATP dependent DNA ligase C terminal region